MPAIPLVLIHGFPLDSRIWQAQVASLSARGQVIAPDLRGFGKSTSSGAFTLASLADDVHKMLRAMNALPCVLGGLSMGGYISLAVSRKYAGDLSGLILIDTKAEADTPAAREGREKMIKLVREKGAKGVADEMLPKMLSPQTLQHRQDIVQKTRQIMESQPAATIENALVALRDREDYRKDLPTISVPTLVIVGEDDAITPPAVAEAMSGAIRNSSLVKVARAGHLSPMEQPDDVTAALRGFVEKTDKVTR